MRLSKDDGSGERGSWFDKLTMMNAPAPRPRPDRHLPADGGAAYALVAGRDTVRKVLLRELFN
jgi:hypothetical protein